MVNVPAGTWRDLAGRFGPPASIEEARGTWGAIVTAAAHRSAITLVSRADAGSSGWAAVVPLAMVPDPTGCPVWPVIQARARLGEVVEAATAFPSPVPQILTRHGRPAAAVIDARSLNAPPGGSERVALPEFLEDGGSVTLTCDPGYPAACDDAGTGAERGRDFTATALGRDGTVIGSGAGATIADALATVYRHESAPGQAGIGAYCDEPPF